MFDDINVDILGQFRDDYYKQKANREEIELGQAMEEDIMILEEFIKNENIFIQIDKLKQTSFNKAIESLIKAYKELKQNQTCVNCESSKATYCEDCYKSISDELEVGNELLLEINAKLENANKQLDLDFVEKHFTANSKIKMKMAELKEMKLECPTFGSMRDYAILILEEILREGK